MSSKRIQSDYSNLKSFQIFNHFSNNSEVTTKAGLARNLYGMSYITYYLIGCTLHKLNCDSFFPRCFDLSDTKQGEEFMHNYIETQIFNIIKKLYYYLKKTMGPLMLTTYQRVNSLAKGLNYRELKSNMILELIQIFPSNPYPDKPEF